MEKLRISWRAESPFRKNKRRNTPMKKILAMLLAALMLLAMVPAMAEGEAPTEITIFYT